MSLTDTNRSIDLTNCDKEKIHQITYTQGHGVFIAFTTRDMRVQHVSQNLAAIFPDLKEPKATVGLKLKDIFPLELSARIQSIIKAPNFSNFKQTSFTIQLESILDVFLYSMEDGVLAIEIEKISEATDIHAKQSSSLVRDAMIRMKNAKTSEELGKIACHSVRLLIGFERVMLYRFYPPTMFGEVTAEDKIAEAKTFNHHRFPATDIPKPARDLYLRNQIRYIHDSSDEGSEVFPKVSSLTGKALDMSDSRLRGVSRIHLEYLKNMDVKGSFSVAVVVDGKLWGLIACHHSKAHYIPHEARENAELIAQILALTAPIFEQKINSGHEIKFQNRLHQLFSTLKQSSHPIDSLFRKMEDVNHLFNVSGFALVSSTRIDFGGITPRREDLQNIWVTIRDWMDEHKTNFFATDSMASLDPKYESIKGLASGVMAFTLSEVDDGIFMVLRPEYLQTILWGGDPRKNFEERNYQGNINPRLSFETWSEVIKNSSQAWEEFEIEGLKNLKSLVFDTLSRKDDLIRELSEKIETYKN